MMSSFLKLLNDNHWYLIAIAVIIGVVFWAYGCESQVASLIEPDKKINRAELKVELEYVVGMAGTRIADLDKQDAIKEAIFNALVLIGQGGQVNTLGIVNLVATIGAISWGLDRSKKLKDARKT